MENFEKKIKQRFDNVMKKIQSEKMNQDNQKYQKMNKLLKINQEAQEKLRKSKKVPFLPQRHFILKTEHDESENDSKELAENLRNRSFN